MKTTVLTVFLALLGGAVLAAAPVDVNTATLAELQRIRGVGGTIAGRILEEREAGGPFGSLEELAARVRGVGPATIAKWREEGSAVAGPAGAEVPEEEPSPAVEPQVFNRVELITAVSEILREYGYTNYQTNNAVAARLVEFFREQAGFEVE